MPCLRCLLTFSGKSQTSCPILNRTQKPSSRKSLIFLIVHSEPKLWKCLKRERNSVYVYCTIVLGRTTLVISLTSFNFTACSLLFAKCMVVRQLIQTFVFLQLFWSVTFLCIHFIFCGVPFFLYFSSFYTLFCQLFRALFLVFVGFLLILNFIRSSSFPPIFLLYGSCLVAILLHAIFFFSLFSIYSPNFLEVNPVFCDCRKSIFRLIFFPLIFIYVHFRQSSCFAFLHHDWSSGVVFLFLNLFSLIY